MDYAKTITVSPEPVVIAAPVESVAARPQRRIIRAKYDAAQTTTENSRHWANADLLSADSAMLAYVRQKLRSRARYEVANNSYAKGIVLTVANDTIGTGPRLQLLTPNESLNEQVEAEFSRWGQSINLAEKLRTMRMAKATDGEAFAILTDNPANNSPIMLDVRLVEADRVTDPTMLGLMSAMDGIEYDGSGNPSIYLVLRQHPGDVHLVSALGAFDRLPAASVIHWYRMDRPEQHRGVPEITSALPLFAQLRRYTLAVLAAAETAADFAMAIYTDAPASGEAADINPLYPIELEQRMATTLPEGWKLTQTKPEQPATTYSDFKQEILNEIARCLNIPYNVAACNSSSYNYASGRLDHQTYYKSIAIEQIDCNTKVLDRILAAWLREARLIQEFKALQAFRGNIPHTWFWDGYEHVDPAKEAAAQSTRLGSLTTTLADEYGKQGKDWRKELTQASLEKKLKESLGLITTAPEPAAQAVLNEDEDEVTDTGE